MARLPTIIADEKPAKTGPGVEADARYPLDRSGAAMGAIGRELSDLAGQVLTAEVAARDADAVTKGLANTSQRLDTLRMELERDPDYANREAKFNAEAKKIAGEFSAEMSPRAKRSYDERLRGLYDGQAHSVRATARRDENEAHRVSLDQSTDTLLETALAAPNRVARAAALDQIRDSFDTAFKTGVLSEAQYKAALKGKLGRFDELLVSRSMRTNPGGALALLKNKDATPNLDPLRREQLAIQAQSRLEQMGALARAEQRATVAEVVGLFDKGIKPENLDRARLLARGNKHFTEAIDEAEGRFHASAQFREMGIADRSAAIAAITEKEKSTGLTGSETALLQTYLQTNNQIALAYEKDPGATAAQRNTAAADALNEGWRAFSAAQTQQDRDAATETIRAGVYGLVEQQKRDGVPEHRIRYMPKAQADKLETDLAKGGAEALRAIETQREAFGPMYWPGVLRQIKPPLSVKVVAAMPGPLRGNKDAMLITEAMNVPAAKWDELLPEKGTRDQFKALAGQHGEAARLTMSRAPGEIEAYADYAVTAETVAKYLYTTKRAASPEAASREAWNIVFNNHWAAAGTVRVPKIEKTPVIDPNMVTAYSDYIRQNPDKLYLAVPAGTYATRGLTDAQRRAAWDAHLKSFGALTADRSEQGVVLRDGEGIIVRGQNGRPIGQSWEGIQNDKEFQAWWRSRENLRHHQTRPGLEPDPSLERLMPPLPADPPSRRRDEETGGDGGDERLGGGGRDREEMMPFDNKDDWQRYYDKEIKTKAPHAQKYPSGVEESASGKPQFYIDFPNTDEGRRNRREWSDYLRERFPGGTNFDIEGRGRHRSVYIIPRQTGM